MKRVKQQTKSATVSGLLRDERGAIMVEYLVLISTVTIGFAIAILSLGPFLVANYERSQAVILSPFP